MRPIETHHDRDCGFYYGFAYKTSIHCAICMGAHFVVTVRMIYFSPPSLDNLTDKLFVGVFYVARVSAISIIYVFTVIISRSTLFRHCGDLNSLNRENSRQNQPEISRGNQQLPALSNASVFKVLYTSYIHQYTHSLARLKHICPLFRVTDTLLLPK